MKTLLLLLFVTLSPILYAQEEYAFPDMRSWMINDGDTTDRYIFADTAFVRISADTKQAPVDTLFLGDNVTITGVTSNALTVRDLKGPWLKIQYTKKGVQKNGYIWQGLVSCIPLRRGDLKFIYAIERRIDSIKMNKQREELVEFYLVVLKVVQNGRLIAKTSFATSDDWSANYSYSKVMSGMGLTNVQNMINVSFGGEACGIPLYDNYFAFTKDNRLIRFPEKMTVGDAGIYYHSETFTFPNEKNGKPDMVIWNMITEEYTGKEDKKGNPVLKTTEKKTVYYAWDGINGKITEAGGK